MASVLKSAFRHPSALLPFGLMPKRAPFHLPFRLSPPMLRVGVRDDAFARVKMTSPPLRRAVVDPSLSLVRPISTDVALGSGKAPSPFFRHVVGPSLYEMARRLSVAKLAETIGLHHFVLDRLQVQGKPRVTADDGHFSYSGPVLWLPPHTENALDATAMGWLQQKLPLVQSRDGIEYRPKPCVLARPFSGPQKIADVLLSDYIIHVQRSTERDGLSESAQDDARRANKVRIQEARDAKFADGSHCILFPEGTTCNDGYVDISYTGGTRLLGEVKEGDAYKPVVMIPVGLAYEFLTRSDGRALGLAQIGEPMVLSEAEREAARSGRRGEVDTLAPELEKRIALATPISASALVGAFFDYRVRHHGGDLSNIVITETQIETLLGEAAATLPGLEGIAFDLELQDPGRRKRFATLIMENLIKRGYLERVEDGAELKGRLTERFERSELPRRRLAFRERFTDSKTKDATMHVTHPVEYWRNRLAQMVGYHTPLSRAIDQIVSAPVPSVTAEATPTRPLLSRLVNPAC